MSNTDAQTPREPVSVYTLLMVMTEQMSAVAWQKLGLQPDMITGTISPDIPQAKVAIDVISNIAQHLEPQLDDEDRRQIQNLVRDLKVNYVQKSNG